jgi:predicted nuclease with TOPRIM domain
VHDQHKTLDNTLTSIAERCERVEFISAEYQSRVEELEKENSSLKDKVTYLESQSMRNNLVLSGFKEETEENLEVKFRDFLVQKLKIAKSILDSIKLERIQYMGAISSDTNREISL